jgi:hypothetical protein
MEDKILLRSVKKNKVIYILNFFSNNVVINTVF